MRLAPNDAEAQSALGWVLAQQGESDAAVMHLRAAIKAKPGFVQARLTLGGRVAAARESLAEAEQEARAAVKIAPDNAEAHRMLAKILSQQPGDEALSEMRRAVELAPERADLRDDLGTIFWRSAISLPMRKAHSKKRCGCNRISSRPIFIWA